MSSILVVEDDNVLREVLVEKLRKTGYDTMGAEDGEVAMKIMRENKPDLILLDILMPKKNGMEVMEEMQEDNELKKIPIIVISNSGQPIEIERAKELGAIDFLIKAVFDPSEVLEKVQGVLGGGLQKKKTEVTDQVSQGNQSNPEIKINKEFKGTKVLVIEDDKFLRELFVRKLTTEGFNVRNAIEAKQAFEMLEEDKPEVILLDLILPGMDGFQILEKIKANEEYKDTPVLILSNLGQQEDIDRAMSLGATDFLVKANFTLDEIILRVKQVLAKRH